MTTWMITLLQASALLVLGLLAGSMFGIWRGYDPAAYSAATFLEVHQGAVRGLNTLLPAMGLAAIVLTVALALLARQRFPVLGLYALAAAGMVAAGLITRLANQPINDVVMGWQPGEMPENWTALRDTWWTWHLLRLSATGAALLLLIVAVFLDREG